MADLRTLSLFDEPAGPAPGSLGCGFEIAATMSEALHRAHERGLKRDDIARRMGQLLGKPVSVAMLNAYTAASRETHEPSLSRAIAFDAAVEDDALLGLYARRRGNRRVISAADAALVELGRIHQQERELAERKKALQVLLKSGGRS